MTLLDTRVSASGHSLPLGETGCGHSGHTATRVSPYARRRAREAWHAIPFAIRVALVVGLLAVLIGFLVLALLPSTWVVSGITAATGILTLAITASVWTGRQP